MFESSYFEMCRPCLLRWRVSKWRLKLYLSKQFVSVVCIYFILWTTFLFVHSWCPQIGCKFSQYSHVLMYGTMGSLRFQWSLRLPAKADWIWIVCLSFLGPPWSFLVLQGNFLQTLPGLREPIKKNCGKFHALGGGVRTGSFSFFFLISCV